MSWEFEQLPGFAHEGSGLIPQSLTGDGLVLGAEIGGIVHKVENSLRVMLSYTIPAEIPGGTATRWRGVDSNFWFRNSHHAAQDRPL
jgi:hypothetical protein